eukprot:7366406-Pyramimonas_sp.AAC.1
MLCAHINGINQLLEQPSFTPPTPVPAVPIPAPITLKGLIDQVHHHQSVSTTAKEAMLTAYDSFVHSNNRTLQMMNRYFDNARKAGFSADTANQPLPHLPTNPLLNTDSTSVGGESSGKQPLHPAAEMIQVGREKLQNSR